eukprot:4816371-Pyramimonas_sp.AAC.1
MDELEGELAILGGFEVAGGLLDLRKFYDLVSLPDLAAAAQDLGYPLRLLALALDVYLGPRLLTLQRQVHTGILPGGGILAGCGQAVSQARAYLHAPLKAAHSSVPGLRLREWIDDLAFRLFGTEHTLSLAFPVVLRALFTGLRRLRCEFSLGKCGLMASSAAIRALLPAWASAAEVGAGGLSTVRVARDLGHDTTFGASRSVKVRKK